MSLMDETWEKIVSPKHLSFISYLTSVIKSLEETDHKATLKFPGYIQLYNSKRVSLILFCNFKIGYC